MLGCDATFFFFNVQILLFKKIYYILFVTPSFFPFGFFNPFFIYLVHTSFFPFHSLTACFFFSNFFFIAELRLRRPLLVAPSICSFWVTT